ncbi:GAF domain-containing sensor histidine kinase [Streptomyces qinzhouensis]|uniref:histidine kinase n=1 Tax=Streptomyces qinzhouensis TaxID=2599401 RepID=A0A5B8IC89_9ACTN|nr:GAF domain-containing sensor histidine kinase [Streptomyces qinzhouensis]QDY75412.1 GAF domain-containing sensor histidine kinase [Streptomyces qinzhouensis]
MSSDRIVHERAALRRVAALVAGAAPPERMFAAVAAEVGRAIGSDLTGICRFDPDRTASAVGAWSANGQDPPFPVGTWVRLGGRNVLTRVFETGGPARIDVPAASSGEPASYAKARGFGPVVGVPISVDGRLWGAVMVISMSPRPLPPDTEDRLAAFTDLVANGIANTQARTELRAFAEEQAALRRVATLVARAALPEQVFAAVATEAGQLIGADFTVLGRYEPAGAATYVAAWTRTGREFPVGIRVQPGGRNIHTLVFESGRPARIDDYTAVTSGAAAHIGRDWGFRAAVGMPISVEGRLWGCVSVASMRDQPLPPDTEERLAGFTELVATAIAKAEAQAALTASRARIVTAADSARRRIERDLHDGTQQRLVSLALQLRTAQLSVPPGAGELNRQLDEVAAGLVDAVDELRELARGIHPAVLAEGGLHAALKALARRSAVPVRLDLRTRERYPEPIEIAAYYAVSEALANTAKHAGADLVDVRVEVLDDRLHISVGDDGHGGADPRLGTGLIGLTDRIEALGGRLGLHSPRDAGTTLRLTLPLAVPGEPPGTAAAGPPAHGAVPVAHDPR